MRCRESGHRVQEAGEPLDTLDSPHKPPMTMKKIEYKHVRYAWKLGTQFSQEKFDVLLMEMLAEHGSEGWDLKGVLYEGSLHAHFIFGREAA